MVLAALLTVIGYTVNDSVVVFDRIREAWAGQPAGTRGPPFHRVVGRAVLATLPRTVNTGLSTMVILVALLVLGGGTLADFALALLIGIVAGTASTVSVAASRSVCDAPPRRPARAATARDVRAGSSPGGGGIGRRTPMRAGGNQDTLRNAGSASATRGWYVVLCVGVVIAIIGLVGH